MPATISHVTNEPVSKEVDEIFREHARLVYRTAYSVTGSLQDAEDVVQNLFLHLLRRGFPPAFNENPKGYLYRAAVNQSLNTVKSRKRQVLPADVVFPEPSVPPETNLEDPTSDQQRVVHAMSQLNPRAVEMLILRYEHDYSDAEIAKMLGTSRGAVAVTLYRARARLKKLLMEKSHETK